MTDPKLIAQAKRGDTTAIASLISRSLQPQGIWARAESHNGSIQIILESTQAPDPDVMEKWVRSGLKQLQPKGISELTLCGWTLGEMQPAWKRQIVLSPPVQLPLVSNKVPIRSNKIARSVPQTQPIPQLTQPRHLHPPENLPMQRGERTFVKRSPQHRRTQKPFVLKWSDFDPVMLTVIGFVAVYGFFGSLNPDYDGPFLWLHYPNLAIHETGHLLFMPFGRFLMLLGGSLTQIAFPAAFTVYFFGSRQYFSSALTLFWTGQNFTDVAVYMRDAPVRLLPLTTDNIDAHDWWQLFRMMRCLDHSVLIANLTHSIGVLILIASVVAGGYFAYQSKQYEKASKSQGS